MMTSSWHAVLVRCKYEPWILAILLGILRVVICFIPQTGYLHPDEFFQSSDIVGGNYFQSKVNPVWEFNTDKPIRCMLIPNLLNTIAFKLATLIQSKPSAYLLIVAPKLIYTLLSFIIDISLYKLCQYYSSRGLWYLPISIIFQSSFVCLGCLTRTLSNTPEVVLFSLLLVVVCQTIRPTFRILFVTPTRSTPVNERIKTSTQLTSSCLVGILITIGTFNRPTFPCFAFVPSIYWIMQSLKRNSYDKTLTIQRVIIPLTLSAILIAIPISAYDTYYYNTTIDYHSLFKNLFTNLIDYRFDKIYLELKSHWILTPYNFIMYNTNVNNLTKYGLHQPYTHMLFNVPFAFNILGLLFYGKLIQLLLGSGYYRLIFSSHRVYALMLLSSLTSIILLSFIPHQEFRFLLPLIVPLVYAFAFNIYASNKLLSLWFIINLILIYFYTSIHQSGVIRASLDLGPILKSQQLISPEEDSELSVVNVVAMRCYLVPTYQWNIPKDDYRFEFDLQDTFADFNTSLVRKIEKVLFEQANNPIYSYKLYVMLPKIYEQELYDYLKNQDIITTKLETIKQYSFHFSGEDFFKSIEYLKKNGLKALNTAFGFSLIKVDLIN